MLSMFKSACGLGRRQLTTHARAQQVVATAHGRKVSPQQQQRPRGQAWAQTRHITNVRDFEFNVAVLNASSTTWENRVTNVKSLKAIIPEVSARDILALGISVHTRSRVHMKQLRRTPNIILPRDRIILVSIGNIKAVIQPNQLVVFEPNSPVVKSWTESLVYELKDSSQSFMMFVLEDLLREVCDSFDRRLVLYSSLLDQIVKEPSEDEKDDEKSESVLKYALFNNLIFEETGNKTQKYESQIYRLAPLSNLLYTFELDLIDAQRCINETLTDPVDISRINGNLTKYGTPTGDETDDDVEWLLENYAMRLSAATTSVLQLQQRAKSQQALSEMGIHLRRNRLLWLNVNLGATSVCVGFATGGMTAFGMNLASGAEMLPYAFHAITVGSIAVSAFIYYRLLMYMRGDFSRNAESRQLAERRLTESIFVDVDAVDVVINTALHRMQSSDLQTISRSEFKSLLCGIKGSKDVDPKEIDALFDLLDVDRNGLLGKHELDICEKETQ